MTITLHPLAERDILSAARFYEDKVSGLGTEFITEVERAVSLASTNPEIGRVLDAPVRRIVLRRFPHSVIYRAKTSEVHILAIAHHRRRPNFWHSRIEG